LGGRALRENSCVGRPAIAPLRLYAASGELLRSVGAGLFAWPHGLYVDADGAVWVTDGRFGEGRGHQVVKLSPVGQVLLTLGEAGVAGADAAHFNGPTAVLVAPNGDIFVADGHGGTRTTGSPFAHDGTLVTWGAADRSRFSVPHALR
jgi:hypothetical protein